MSDHNRVPVYLEDVGISQEDAQTLRTLQTRIGALIRKQREIKDRKETQKHKINIVAKGNADKATKFFGLGKTGEGSFSIFFFSSFFYPFISTSYCHRDFRTIM